MNAPRPSSVSPAPRAGEMPPVAPSLLHIFSQYSTWYIRRNFHAVRLSVSGDVPAVGNIPLVVYLNHASWWDPLIGLLLARKFLRSRQHFAPIDAAALSRYRILSRLGFFGVEAKTRHGATMFLRSSLAILRSPVTAIWITSEGQFRDPRTRPVELRPGLAHLARRVTPAAFVSLAIEYPFWEERFPEVLCRFGTPIHTSTETQTIYAWTAQLTEAMRINQDTLAAESIARRPEAFETILRGRAGVGAIYDAWRWSVSLLKGKPFQRQHGEEPP